MLFVMTVIANCLLFVCCLFVICLSLLLFVICLLFVCYLFVIVIAVVTGVCKINGAVIVVNCCFSIGFSTTSNNKNTVVFANTSIALLFVCYYCCLFVIAVCYYCCLFVIAVCYYSCLFVIAVSFLLLLLLFVC